MEKMDLFIDLLRDVLAYANNELSEIKNGHSSLWEKGLIEDVVIPEMNELLEHALKGEFYIKNEARKRLLLTSYFMTDTLVNLEDTCLGKKVTALQKLYTSL